MRMYLLFFQIIVTISCRTENPSSIMGEPESPSRPLPLAAQKIWDAYAFEQSNGIKLQEDCTPIQLNPPMSIENKGLFVMYHGFSGCPIQFINIGKKLAAQGFHVLLPLLPGQGRVPLEINRDKALVTDDQRGMPETIAPYQQLSATINSIAEVVPGYRVVAGLSGGGGQAMGTAIAGINPSSKTNIWSRAALYVPFFKIPGIQGDLSPLVSVLLPGFYKGFGPDCQQSQLSLAEPRRGMCDFSLKHLRAMVDYGAEAASRAGELTIPVQIAGVENDGASDGGAIIEAFKKISSKDKHLCFFQEGVQHAVFYEKDYDHLDVRPWVPEAESALLAWVNKGSPFPTSGLSTESPFVGTNLKQARCKIVAPLRQSKS